jgi:hypothetical protein
MQEISEKIRTRVADEFTVLVFGDNVEKTEVEIVYDPHFKCAEHVLSGDGLAAMRMQEDRLREITQTDNYMGGKG